ncbi:MAG: chemotaxis response regulator protein-glutamate methylesterase [Chloroflexi bacterium]|nr:chemotaxis response regulator protein-glutamate methylesterase [Chloroflexota bacterium]
MAYFDLTRPSQREESLPRSVRVLVVDDSAYIRFTLGRHLGDAPGIEVVGAAHDGLEALELISRLQPDVVTLDIQMPKMNGLSTLREIMARHPLPVIMLSSLTTESAAETVQALTWGAVDFVAKPSGRANVAAIADEVVSKVLTAARARVNIAPLNYQLPSPPRRVASNGVTAVKSHRPLRPRDKVVVIGSSTGGPRALNTVVANLPADLQAAVLIVQHMPGGFTQPLAERLNSVSMLSVKEADEGDVLEIGRVLLAPGGYHMRVEADRIVLNQKPTVHGVRPAVDVTMTSVAQMYGGDSVGVVLTGMGYDGTNGAALIHSTGGTVIVEDETTCMVWGMPRSVAEAGVADVIAPLPEIAQAIVNAVGE